MSKQKSGSGCFGLFVKSWLISVVALGGLTAAAVALGIRYFGWSSQSWSDFSAFSSYPVLASLMVMATATLLAFSLSAFIGVASALFGRGGGGGGGSSSGKPKSRPQSNRKTTV